jgi:hypothetical protein
MERRSCTAYSRVGGADNELQLQACSCGLRWQSRIDESCRLQLELSPIGARNHLLDWFHVGRTLRWRKADLVKTRIFEQVDAE